jgi:Flp pilus assembly pilin Flp
MTALAVYLQNSWFRLRERQEGQTMAEYALVLGLIAIFVMVAVFFLGGKIKELFNNTGSSVQNAPNGLGS